MQSSSMAVVCSKIFVEIPEDFKSYPRFLLNKFEEHGDNIAIVDSETKRSYTYKQLSVLIRKCGSALLRRGFKPCDTLAIMLPNIPEWPIVLYGASAVGGIITTLNPVYTIDEIQYQLKDSGATFVVTTPQLGDKVKAAASRLNIKNIFVLGEAEGFESLSRLFSADDGSMFQFFEPTNWKSDVVLLPYSSGTTGLPKGVMLTHYNMVSHTLVSAISMSYRHMLKSEARLGLVPFSHSYGLSVLIGTCLYKGYKMVCLNRFEADSFLKTILDYKIPFLNVVPPLALFLAKDPLVLKYDLSHVEAIFSGAAPLGEDVSTQLKIRFPSIKFIQQGYGMTETSAVIVSPPGFGKAGSVGMLLPNLEAKVLDLETGDLLGPGKDGEICLRGPTIMKGYYNKPDATERTLDKDGWLHTGDIGHYDEDEYFFIVDRVKELIKYKAWHVPPAQLEDVLLSHPQITDAAVIGIPDQAAGELPKAFVVAKVTLTEKEVADFVAIKVAPYKKLRGGVEFVNSIPKSPSGKILRRQLREQASKQASKQTNKLI